MGDFKTITVPLCSSQKYLIGYTVVIIHEYPKYGLCKIRYQDKDEEFLIDIKSLSDDPKSEHTINVGLLEEKLT